MNYLNKALLIAAGVMSIVCTSGASACDFHGEGMAGFAAYHPMMQQHMQQTRFDNISVTVPGKVSTSTGVETNSELAFFVPTSFYDVSVNIKGSEHIKLLSEESIRIAGITKKSTMIFRAMEKGEHTITVILTAKRGSTPVEIEKTLKIQSV